MCFNMCTYMFKIRSTCQTIESCHEGILIRAIWRWGWEFFSLELFFPKASNHFSRQTVTVFLPFPKCHWDSSGNNTWTCSLIQDSDSSDQSWQYVARGLWIQVIIHLGKFQHMCFPLSLQHDTENHISQLFSLYMFVFTEQGTNPRWKNVKSCSGNEILEALMAHENCQNTKSGTHSAGELHAGKQTAQHLSKP